MIFNLIEGFEINKLCSLKVKHVQNALQLWTLRSW